MRFSRVAIVVVLFLFACGVAAADGIPPGDPQVILGGDPAVPTFTVTTQNFTLPPLSSSVTSFQIDIINNTGVVWNSLQINYAQGGLSCALTENQSFFSTATSVNGGAGCLFSGVGGGFAGIAPCTSIEGDGNQDADDLSCVGAIFGLTLNGFPTNQDFFLSGNANVPEPATFGLLLMGLGGLALKRRPLKR